MKKLLYIAILSLFLIANTANAASIPNFWKLTGGTTLEPILSTWTVSIPVLSIGALTMTGDLDMDGNSIILDADGDSSITADTDDQIDFAVNSVDMASITTAGLTLNGTMTQSRTYSALAPLNMLNSVINGNNWTFLSTSDNEIANQSILSFYKNATTTGGYASTTDSDDLGEISFFGQKNTLNTGLSKGVNILAEQVGAATVNGISGKLEFSTYNNGVENADQLTLYNNGYVGINTDTPVSLLNINGSVGNINQGITFGNDTRNGIYEHANDTIALNAGNSTVFYASSSDVYLPTANICMGQIGCSNSMLIRKDQDAPTLIAMNNENTGTIAASGINPQIGSSVNGGFFATGLNWDGEGALGYPTYWAREGVLNASLGGRGLFFGSTEGIEFHTDMDTATNTAMVIDTSGNVGIGTTSFAYATLNIGVDVGVGNGIIGWDNIGNKALFALGSQPGNAEKGSFNIYDGSGSPTGDISFNADGDSWVMNSLGIGTTTPRSLLEVYGSSGNLARFGNYTTTNTVGVEIDQDAPTLVDINNSNNSANSVGGVTMNSGSANGFFGATDVNWTGLGVFGTDLSYASSSVLFSSLQGRGMLFGVASNQSIQFRNNFGVTDGISFLINADGTIGTYAMDNDTWINSQDNAGTGVVNMFKVNTSDIIEAGADLQIGTLIIDEDSGAVELVDMSVSDTPVAGTEQSYSFDIDDIDIFTIYSEADSSGGIQNEGVWSKKGFRSNVTAVANGITALTRDTNIIAVDTTLGIATTTLPTVGATATGTIFMIKDVGGNASGNNIVIQTEGSETIDGSAIYTLSSDYESVSFFSYNNNWFAY